ncbi:hypothetical protein [Micromonospora sp. CA-248212]|uniref:hypothetical protein n=1 Tax=Micromonospora sp. CA-248212 TaxID=3239961 RepID=UPI003D91D939
MAGADSKPVQTGIGWGGATAVILAGMYPAFHGVYWAIPVSAAVRILGLTLNHLHWRDVEVPAADD